MAKTYYWVCVKYREDVYSSDREIASFMLALEKLRVDY